MKKTILKITAMTIAAFTGLTLAGRVQAQALVIRRAALTPPSFFLLITG